MHEKTFHRITCNHLGKEKLTNQTVKEGVKKYIKHFFNLIIMLIDAFGTKSFTKYICV